MDIEIKNADSAINDCNQLVQYSAQMQSQVDSLKNSLNRINANWESNGADKQSYVTELEKQIENLGIIEQCVTKFASTVRYYAEQIKATSAKKVK